MAITNNCGSVPYPWSVSAGAAGVNHLNHLKSSSQHLHSSSHHAQEGMTGYSCDCIPAVSGRDVLSTSCIGPQKAFSYQPRPGNSVGSLQATGEHANTQSFFCCDLSVTEGSQLKTAVTSLAPTRTGVAACSLCQLSSKLLGLRIKALFMIDLSAQK